MPRNTVASKSAAGPSNTSDSETVTVSNPQAKLTTANAKIERLRELLEARDTPASGGDKSPSDTHRLATVLAALSQRLSGPSKTYAAPPRSTKVAEPLLLTDGTEPTFDNWKLQLQDKLEVNANHFPTP